VTDIAFKLFIIKKLKNSYGLYIIIYCFYINK